MSPKSYVSAAALLAALALPAVSLAQTTPPAATGATPQVQAPETPAPVPGPAAGHAAKRRNAATGVEQRIDQLHAELRITPAQQQQWDQFAQIMRDNASNTRQAFDQRGAQLASMTAVQNMQSYTQIAQQHAEEMQKLSAAFQTLYSSMSDAQKQEADAVFRGRAAAHEAHRKGTSHG